MKELVIRKNAVRECVASKSALSLSVLDRFEKDPIVAMARRQGITVRLLSEKELDRLAGCSSHQGFAAEVEGYETVPLKNLISKSPIQKYPLLLMLDGIEDPHNLGAILRSADAFGVDGVIIKSRGNAPLNSTVARVSTGAINYVPVASVSNLSQAISELKDAGYWIVSSDGSGKQSYADVDYRCPICVVVGSEGFGISRLVLQNSDFVVKIPMQGHVNSLNASVATGILLSQVSLNRK